MANSNQEQKFERKDHKSNAFFLAAFLIVFFVFSPLLISRSVNRPMKPIDWSPMSAPGGDYVATYAAANSLRSGFSIYKNNAAQGDVFADRFAGGDFSRYSYPPLQAYLFVPLSFFSFEHSYLAWNIISIFFILFSILLVSQLVKRRFAAFVFLSLIYVLSSFFWFQIERGQTDALSLFLISLFIYFYAVRKNVLLTAIFFALACLLKVFPIIFVLFFLVRKEYRLLAISFLCGVAVILLTEYQTWMYWLSTIYPMYANYYLGSEVDHSLAYLLSGLADKSFFSLVKVSRLLSVIFSVIFFALVFIGKRRKELLLLELAIISIIMEITPPWAANYKLVLMIFLFAAPIFFLEQKFIKRKFVAALPILVAFVFMLPIYNEFYARLPFSFLGKIIPTQFVPFFPLQKIAEHRVSLALVFCLLYLFFIYVYLKFRDTRFLVGFEEKILQHKGRILKTSCILVLALVLICAFFSYKKYFVLKAKYQKDISAFGKESKVSEEISVVGYNVEKNISGSYKMEIIFKVNKKLKKNLMIYLHGHWQDGSQSVEGANFFPYILTNFWPAGKYVVVSRNVSLTPRPQDIRIGFFDMSDGARYGEEVDLGIFNLK